MPMSFGGVSKQKVATVIVAADGSGDTTDIQTGIDLLGAAGGKVVIKEGTYTITTAVTSAVDSILIEGFKDATIVTGNNLDKFFDFTGDYFSIRDLKIVSTGINATFNGAIHSTGDHCIVSSCTIIDANSYGISIKAGDYCLVENCYVDSSIGVGIYYEGSRGIIKDCYVVGTVAATGIYMQTGSDTTVFNNHVVDCYNGIVANGRTTISGNFVTGMTNGFSINVQVDYCVVIGNRVINGVNDGISTSAEYGVFEGNVIIDTRGTPEIPYGLDERTGADYNIFLGNATVNMLTGTINVIGANTINEHNI